MQLKKRNIVLCTVLYICTCGLYEIVWIALMAEDLKRVGGQDFEPGGLAVTGYALVTCFFYYYYWVYKAGEKLDNAKMRRRMPVKASGMTYLVLSICFLRIISLGLIQSEINEIADADSRRGRQ